ncbi:MAG: Uma2 family endonuclease [Oscillospiraceae bacterium]|nr:Uma2 family endonuclease [Oscillospiraceae bacterium]
MGITAKESKKYTVSEYYALLETENTPTELMEGIIVDMASPNIQHQRISGNLHFALKQHIHSHNGACEVFNAPTDVQLDEYNLVIPDVFIACHPDRFDSQKYNGAPDFVAEVVSTNRSDDFIKKLYLYQRAGVREYWIIDPKAQKTVVYQFEESLFPTIYPFDMPIPVGIYQHSDHPLEITIADLF